MAAKKKQNKTIAQRLKGLYELQLIDSQLDEIKVLKGELPMEVQDLEDEITGFSKRIERLNDGLNDLDAKIADHDKNIKEAQALIERYTKQLDDVKNNREFEALTKEIEMQNLEIQLSEKRIGEAKAEVEDKKEKVETAEARVESKKKELESKNEELTKIIAKTEKDEEKLNKKSERAKKGIEDRLLISYTKIRNTYRNGLSVVHIEREACGGCFNKVPPQLKVEIAQHQKIITCEHCGRILVDDNILQAE